MATPTAPLRPRTRTRTAPLRCLHPHHIASLRPLRLALISRVRTAPLRIPARATFVSCKKTPANLTNSSGDLLRLSVQGKRKTAFTNYLHYLSV